MSDENDKKLKGVITEVKATHPFFGEIKRATGYYWIKYDVNTDWEPAEYSSESESWLLTGSELHSVDGEFHEIDERQIVRNKIQNDLNNLVKIDETKFERKGLQDLTKPMWHDMNPLQRNYMDSTH